MTQLRDIAVVLRSKIAGPYLLSLEAYFSDIAAMASARKAGMITSESISKAYNISKADVRSIDWYDAVPAVKCVIIAPVRSDDPTCRDVYGSQSQVPFGDLFVD